MGKGVFSLVKSLCLDDRFEHIDSSYQAEPWEHLVAALTDPDSIKESFTDSSLSTDEHSWTLGQYFEED